MAFKEIIKKLRVEKDLTQDELAKVLNVKRSTVSGYESGRNEPSYEILQKLSDYFDVTVDFLLGKTEVKKAETGKNAISPAYFRLAKYAEERGISPEDVEDIIHLLEKAKKRDRDAGR
ncbi:MAG: helix-turn-helix domain-containing protein [Clostridia bacterium]|nr:helix-turn-helix domain-containing protein [Clostridia bacterium]